MSTSLLSPQVSPSLLGREAALAELTDALQFDDRLPAVSVIVGEPGIGKTTLLDEAIEIARGRAAIVLRARPAFGERDLPYAGLGDLLDGVPDEHIARLPDPLRQSVNVALLREAPATDESADWHAVAQGLLEVLRGLLSTGPVLLAIDDEPWLDPSTSRVLDFALRRLSQERLTVLLARRPQTTSAERRAQIAEDLPEKIIELGPMSAAEIGRLVRERLDLTLPAAVAERLHASTGGNPFYALQIASLWRQSGPPRSHEPFPLPDRLRDVVTDRLAGLSDAALEVLLVVSAAPRADLALVDLAVADPNSVRAGVEEAEEAGVIVLDGQQIRFAHPLLAAGVYGEASAPRRRQLHRRLAEVSGDPEEIARHLAAATVRPDGEVAELIAKGAVRAAARGAPDAAASLYERAAALTPDDAPEQLRTRMLGAADAYASAGDYPRARSVLEDLIGRLPAGDGRAEALSRLATIFTRSHGVELAVDSWQRALTDAAPGSVLAGDIHDNLAWYVCWLGDSTGAHQHALEAQKIAEAAGNEPLLLRALTKVAMLDFQLGRGINRPVLERAAAVERATEGGTLEAEGILVQHLIWSDQLTEARERGLGILDEARRRGDVGHEMDAIYYLVGIELYLGNLDDAQRHADAVYEKAVQAGAEFTVAVIKGWQARIAAARGQLDEARRLLVNETLPAAQREKHRWVELASLSTLAFIELSAGDPASARKWGLMAAEMAKAIDVPEPGIFHVVPDAIEALIGTGELETAAERLTEFQAQADATDRKWAHAAGARCRGLLLAAQGDVASALTELDRSVSAFRELPYRFELARSLVAAGAAHRRARNKREARQLLTEAAEIFGQMGSSTWQDRAMSELRRIDGRAPSTDAGLTQTERQVAELVAAGLSNREVAERLFITVRTVESNLTRIYQKLDVPSRTHLSRLLSR